MTQYERKRLFAGFKTVFPAFAVLFLSVCGFFASIAGTDAKIRVKTCVASFLNRFYGIRHSFFSSMEVILH